MLTSPVPQIVSGGPNTPGRRKRALDFPRMGVDVSPPSDSGCREPYPEGDGKRVTGGPGQAGNGAALLGAMGALGSRGGGSARIGFRETGVHRENSHLLFPCLC